MRSLALHKARLGGSLAPLLRTSWVEYNDMARKEKEYEP